MTLDAFAHHVRNDQLPLVRTDFSDDRAWNAVLTQVQARYPGAVGVEDRGFAGMTDLSFRRALGGQMSGVVVLVDARSMREQSSGGPEVTVAWIDLAVDEAMALDEGNEAMGTFRCPIEHVDSVALNLDVANLDFEDFSDNMDDDGVFRQFGPDND